MHLKLIAQQANDDDDDEDKTLEEEAEEERVDEFLHTRQLALSNAGAAQMIVRIISESEGIASPRVREALALACAMLNGGNDGVQKVCQRVL